MSRRRLWPALLAGGLLIGLTAGLAAAFAAPGPRARRTQARVAGPRGWIASWAASPQAASPWSPHARGFADQTIREIIYTSTGGTLARVRLDNRFGLRPVTVGRAAVAVAAGGPRIVPGTRRELTFGRRPWTVIAPGGEVLSDPIHLAVRPFERLAVSLFVPRVTGAPTEHYDAHQINYVAAGDHAFAAGPAPFKTRLQSWYFLAGLDVWSPPRGVIVALGDSITNGNGSVTGANARWPNDLSRRLGGTVGVIDAGIEGNRVLNASPCCGPSALSRFTADVLRQPGVKEVIVLEGINDIGFARSRSPLTAPDVSVSAQQIIAGYKQLIKRAHAAGLKIFGATLTPFAGSQHWSPGGEAEREQINAWIRSSHAFDGVIDFAAVVADPRDTQRLNPRYDDGDHLHLDDAGYQAMANAIDLTMLLRGLPRPMSR